MLSASALTPSIGEQAFDEFHADSSEPRAHYRALWDVIGRMGSATLAARAREAELALGADGAEVLVPGGGWIGFDAVHGRVADARYVRVAAGRDHADTAPRRGTFLGAERGDVVEVRSAIVRQYQQ